MWPFPLTATAPRGSQTKSFLINSWVAEQVISDQVLEVGEAKFSLPQLLVRDDMPQLQGMIGMDLLRGSVLVISPKADDPIHWPISSK
jgi:hypothetical protein